MHNSILQDTAISLGTLRALCPAEVKAIESHPGFPGWGEIFNYLGDEDEFLLYFFTFDDDLRANDDWESIHMELSELWTSLCDAFFRATKGAVLGMIYFDISCCDSNDSIPSNADGCIFTVDGTHETKLTPAGEILEGQLETVLLTQYV